MSESEARQKNIRCLHRTRSAGRAAACAAPKPRSRRRFRGQAVVEFAIILPVMMLLLLIVLDFGRVFFSYVQVSNAAREAANYGASNPTDNDGMLAVAEREMNAQGQNGQGAVAVAVVCHNASGATINCVNALGGSGPGSTVTVTATERFTFLTPLIGNFFGGHVTMTSVTTATVLGFAAGGGSAGDCSTAPSGDFTYTVTGLTVDVDASAMLPKTGTCAIAGYNWDMGDGADPWPPIVDMNPAPYTYATAGVYNIQVCVTNPVTPAGGYCISHIVPVGISPTPTPTATSTPTPTPAPTASPTSVCGMVPSFTYKFTGNGNGTKAHQMTFYGSSGGQPAPTSWSWNFGDGSGNGSGVQDSHNYTKAGTFTVTMTVSSSTCTAHVSESVVVP